MEKYLLPVFNRKQISFVKGEGVWLETDDGSRYLDIGAGIAVNVLGHCNKNLVSVLTNQAQELWHTSNLYRITNQEKLAKILITNTFAEVAFFTNSGTEATECAIKMARKFHSNRNDNRHEIISFDGSFHGRSIGAISTSSSKKMKEGFGPLLPGCKSVDMNDKGVLINSINPKTAAVIIEPIQGEGGIKIVPSETIHLLRDICDKFGVLLIFDEVQCGVGRSGKLFAHEWVGIVPDIMTIAKGIGGGMPLGACIATKRAAEGMTIGSHGTTYGGNPLACAVGCEVLNQVLSDKFLPNVIKISNYFSWKLKAIVDSYPSIFKEVRGTGLMLGLKMNIKNDVFVETAFNQGILTVPASENVVRILPPLNITESEVDLAIGLLTKTAESIRL